MPIKIALVNADVLEKVGALAIGQAESLVVDIVTASKTFGFDAVARAKRDYLRGPKPEKIQSKGQLKSRINTETQREGSLVTTHVGTDVVYGRIQEKGGVTRPNLTEKMRKFAWAMFFNTKDEMWKRMALSKKAKLKIKIPPRPYIEPAIKDAMPDFKDNLLRILLKVSFVAA